MRRLLMIGALGAGLAIVGAACVPMKAPAPKHDDLYYTEVHIQPDSVSGSYATDTTCVLEDGTTSTHTDMIDHTIGTDTIKTHTWPDPGPVDCSVTEAAGPPMTSPKCFLLDVAPADYFGAPTVYEPITGPTATPQNCHQKIIGTYFNLDPPLDFWDCYFAVSNG
jgi:hypothetical protein